MEREFNLGLVKDRHLTQLFLLMDHATAEFDEEKGTNQFFESIMEMVVEENHRRKEQMERENHTVAWTFDESDLHPVAMMCLLDFFRRKTHQFKNEEPPVSTFFNRIKQELSNAVDREIAPSLQRTIREKQLEVRKESTVKQN